MILSVVDESFTCYYFTKILEVHLRPCTCFFYPRLTRPWMVYLFLLSLPVRIFLGLVGEVASPPIVFTPTLWRGFHLTIRFVYFYKLSFQHLGLMVKTWGLCSVLKGSSFRYYLYNIFLDEAPKLSEKYISCQFLIELLRFLLPLDIIGGLLYCCRFVSHVQTGQSLEGSAPLLRVILMVQCLQRFWIKLIFDYKWRTRKSATRLLFTSITTEKFNMGSLPSLWHDFWCIHISSCYVRRRV